MIHKYQQITPFTKIVSFALILFLSGVVSVRFDYNIALVLISVAAIGIVTHLSLTYLNSVFAAIVILLELGLFYITAGNAILNLGPLEYVLNLNLQVVETLILTLGIFVVTAYSLFAYRFSKGKLWSNLLVAFILFNGVSTPIWIFEPSRLVLGLSAGFAAGLLYLTLRGVQFRRKSSIPVVPKQAINSLLKKKILTILDTTDVRIRDVTRDENWKSTHFVISDDYKVYNIHALSARSSFVIKSSGVYADGNNINELVEGLRLDVLRNKDEVPVRQTVSVLLLPAESLLPQGIKTLTISHSRQPDRSAGLIVISTPKRFKKLIQKQASGKKMSEKDAKKLDFKEKS